MFGDRLGAEDVERSPGDLSGIKRGLEILVDDQRPSRDVEHAHAVSALRERSRVQPPLGVRCLGQMEREKVGDGVDVIGARRLLDAELAVAIGRHVRVVRDDSHPERLRPLCDELSDPAEPEDAERLA